jgi:hypothetical protein
VTQHLDPAFVSLDRLVAEWRGRGSGDYPTMTAFDYEEEIRFVRLDEGVLRYEQRATGHGDGRIMHAEVGIWRLRPGGRIEVSIAFPSVTEVTEGTTYGDRIELASTSVGRATLGAQLVQARRTYDLAGEPYDIHMAARDVSLTRHVWATLRRVG